MGLWRKDSRRRGLRDRLRPQSYRRDFSLQGQTLEDRRMLAQVGVSYFGPDGNEDFENVKFLLSRSPHTTGDLIVSYSLSGTANEGGDYPSQTGSVTIPDGMMSSSLPSTTRSTRGPRRSS